MSEAIDVLDMVQSAPPAFDPVLLDLGRRIYSRLQTACQAALDRQSTLLKVSIDELREGLALLRRSSEQIALETQLRALHNDLRDTSKEIDADIWVPLQIEVDEALVHMSDERRERDGCEQVG